MHFCHFSSNESIPWLQNTLFFYWKELKLVQSAWVVANLWLRKRCSKDLNKWWSNNDKSGEYDGCSSLLCGIWLEFIEQHEGEHCAATKWLDGGGRCQVPDDKAPIVRNRHSQWVLARSNSNELVLHGSKNWSTSLCDGENLVEMFELIFGQVTTIDCSSVN